MTRRLCSATLDTRRKQHSLMKGKNTMTQMDTTAPRCYRIHIQESLGSQWTLWIEPLTLTYTADGSTLLQGSLPDQSALYGMLNQIAQLGLTLLSVESTPGVGRDALYPVEHRPLH